MTEVFVSSSNRIRLARALPARRTVWVSCSRAAHTQGWGEQVSLITINVWYSAVNARDIVDKIIGRDFVSCWLLFSNDLNIIKIDNR